MLLLLSSNLYVEILEVSLDFLQNSLCLCELLFVQLFVTLHLVITILKDRLSYFVYAYIIPLSL